MSLCRDCKVLNRLSLSMLNFSIATSEKFESIVSHSAPVGIAKPGYDGSPKGPSRARSKRCPSDTDLRPLLALQYSLIDACAHQVGLNTSV